MLTEKCLTAGLKKICYQVIQYLALQMQCVKNDSSDRERGGDRITNSEEKIHIFSR